MIKYKLRAKLKAAIGVWLNFKKQNFKSLAKVACPHSINNNHIHESIK